MKTAISYVRWSSPKQSHGESLERQLSKTKEFCATHGLTLDLELVDSGKSAFKGKHTSKGGALASFLDNLKAGLIPKGAILIVESLDRLSRDTVPVALRQFLEIIEHDVEIVTLIDGHWYSRKSLGADSTPLLMSLVYMMRAHDESKHKAYRLGKLWKGKRERAVKDKTPMTGICPAWLQLSGDKKRYEVRPDRVKKVKLMFWLWNRGWSRQRIAKLFNTREVPVWGKKKRRTFGWHHSYIDKILHTRAVLGEFVPHSTKDPKDDHALAGPRKPASVIQGYYPVIIPEAVYFKAQSRCSGPRGPIGHTVANLYQGLLKDGENPGYTMYYRDHGMTWQYVVSDYRRVNTKAPLFSWPYAELEDLLLKYITDLDWSSLTVSTGSEVSILRDQLAVTEGKLKELNKEMGGLVDLMKVAVGIPELGAKMTAIESERNELRKQVSGIRSDLKAKEGFIATDGLRLITELAANRKSPESRLKLRYAIRQNIKLIELFRHAPEEIAPGNVKKMDRVTRRLRLARGIKLHFMNGATRWITARSDGTDARLDGKLPAKPEIVQDGMGGVVQDMRQSKKLKPVKAKSRDAWHPPITQGLINKLKRRMDKEK